ncbi:exoribonuclease II [Orbaceae bacterium ESL0721]|nr:exoribonuclease II [Orbaceae bacterium ESL0721]
MLQNNPLLAQLKQQLHETTPRIEGTVRLHEKGFGFLDVDNKTNYFIPTSKAKLVNHGDKVSGIVVNQNGKESFEPEQLIESALEKFIAKVGFENGSMVIYPENRALPMRCKVNSHVSERLKAGDWVVAKLISHPLEEGKNHFFAEVNQFIISGESPYQLWYKTIANYELEANAPPYEPLEIALHESEDRQDLTHLPFFTIDSEHTQDMDDAIFITKDEQGNYQLSIAIADPTAYILPDTELDKLAKARNFTTYLPDFTVPMLPKEFANELCSLHAGERRAAMVCQLTVDKSGNLLDDLTFMPAWITSKSKLSYNNVSDFIESDFNKDIAPLQFNETLIDADSITTAIKLLAEFTEIRALWRKEHALTFKNSGDFRFQLDEHRKVTAIIKDSQRIAHQMVEEAMVVANQALTRLLKDKIGFGIFNAHSGFDIKYIDQLLKMLSENGISNVDKSDLASLPYYIMLRRQFEEDPFLAMRMRKFQSAADFTLEPQPHFGLGFDAYATWTSPIRKYGDMVNHRIIKAWLRGEAINRPDPDQLAVMAERRKRVRFAERDIADALYVDYLADKMAANYAAEVVDINRGGMRVRLVDIGASAFIPLSLLHPVRDEINSLPEDGVIKIGDEIRFKLADQITITLHDVNRETKRIIAKLPSC